MNPWIIPTTCAIGAVLVSTPAFQYVHMLESHDKMETDYFLSIRVEDVPLDRISAHVARINSEHRFSAEWVEPRIRAAHEEFPEGTVFFFNTPQERWGRLGGEAGYAILLNGRVVWRRYIAKS